MNKPCCALRFLIRQLRGDPPQERFTCTKCGQSYRYIDWQWQQISTVDDIKDMIEQAKKQRNV